MICGASYILLCTTVLVQDTSAGVKNDSMVCKKLGDIFEMVEIKKELVYPDIDWQVWPPMTQNSTC